jgi:SAM-dependent methyltransferase
MGKDATATKDKAKGGGGGGKPKHKPKHNTKKIRRAETEDRHRLYELSVQATEPEIDFVDDTFKKLRGRPPATLREDFCGTAQTCVEFIKRRPENRAWGVDLDKPTLDWGFERRIARLDEADRERVTLLNENVLQTTAPAIDAVLAMNFSYFIFKTRDELREYFASVRETLGEGGMLFMDCYGGSEAFTEMEEDRDVDPEFEDDVPEDMRPAPFTYHWDQHSYHPVTGHMQCRIHFSFPDKSRMDNAFIYDWRLWTIPELRELLAEAGFSKVSVYWEGTDEDDPEEGNGEYEVSETGDPDPAWVSYIVAEK